MPRRQKVPPFSLVRKRIRQSFNKLNIYNAMTWRKNRPFNSQYRQLFFAKQESRAYHGEGLTETQFRNVFRSELTSVSPLQSKAKRDGVEQEIPHALQTFVALERRLDTAVFRALFASSLRQASQYVVTGAVKVNGVKISQPGYVLRAGDMFSVDPNRVLEGLGRPKPSAAEAITQTNRIIRKYNKYLERCRKSPKQMWKSREARRKRHVVYNSKQAAKENRAIEQHNKSIDTAMKREIDAVKPRLILETALKGEKVGGEKLAAKSGALHGLVRGQLPPKDEAGYSADEVRDISGRYYDKHEPGAAGVANKSDVKKLCAELVQLKQDEIRTSYSSRLRHPGKAAPYDPTWVDRLPQPIPEIDPETDPEEFAKMKLALPFSTTGKLYGLAEPEKRWFTPWVPRQFVAAMAVLPHHLEVSHETCHAIYLRDPVARPNHSEVISPFSLDMHERVHMWYNYRRRKNLARTSSA